MLASPSIQEIASALAKVKSPETKSQPGVRSPSRVLCLRLQENSRCPSITANAHANDESSKRARGPRSPQAIAEAFLKFSPRVIFRTVSSRSGADTLWIFVDIASTAHLFASRTSSMSQPGEEALMVSAINLARDLGFGVQCAVADTPAGAQAFAMSRESDDGLTIIPPGEERDRLKSLSLPHILHLEGLEPWDRPVLMENIVTFFMMLGFRTLGDLSRFSVSSLQERWGEVGEILWRRLNAHDRQVISAMLPTEPLHDYVHLDFPLSLVSLILRQTEKSIHFLFSRLQGRRLFAKNLVMTLHCEYSKSHHKITLEPNTPSRDVDLFITLLEERLANIDLANPVREIEVQIVPCPEKSRQMDFFEPRTTDSDKVQTLLSLLSQSSIQAGLYRIEPGILPESSWRLAPSPEERNLKYKYDVPLEPRAFAIGERHKDYHGAGVAITPTPFYSAGLMRAPRPTRILREPLALSVEELERMTILSTNPIERIESAWWQNGGQERDYYFAVSTEGDCLWIFRDPRRGEYFLHGYFD